MATITPEKPEDGCEPPRRERLRREDPERTGPIRNWSTLYRRSDSWNRQEPSAQPKPAAGPGGGSCSDVVSHGVELGYRVVEEQIRQGQRVAEQLSNRSYDAGAMSGDLREIADRAWRYYTDLGGLGVDFLVSLANDGDLVRRVLGAWQPRPASSPPAPSEGAIGISVEVSSTRRAWVTLDLHPHSETMSLVCQELRALDAEKPPLTDVRFESGSDGIASLCIRVPDAQPPGIYAGAVIDAHTGQPRGTLSVRVV